MQITSSRDGSAAMVEPTGLIDTRAAQEFERHVVKLYDEGARLLVVDLSKTELITSAGIRVLVMMAQRLQRTGGGLALCALSEKVRGVFDVAGLLSQFRIAPTRQEAAALLAPLEGATAARSAPVSKLTRIVRQVAAEGESPAPGPRAAGSRSRLTGQIADLLEPRTGAEGEPPARG